MIDREKERITAPLPVCWERQTQAEGEDRKQRGQRESGWRGMFMCFLFGSNGDSLTPPDQSR